MKRGFQIHPEDNVATLLEDAQAEMIIIIRGDKASLQQEITLKQPVALGHKIALTNIADKSPVIKYGIQIGVATQEIQPGEWVHLHNCASFVDERSKTMDVETGAPTDTAYT
jgi:altronate hydrolase/altronate dehydratase small subunit